ncbi:MAG: hypothetical protein NDJ72_08915 [Elusimicrobia bacterium]|nr:hypothetical protein [Elusimicrobiota bacterium]
MPAKISVFRALFGTADAGFAWGLAALSGVFAWIFLVDADLSGWRYRRVETVTARVEYCERTEHDVGGPPRRQGGGRGTPIFKHYFAFTDARTGARRSGVSYQTGVCLDPGREVIAEHPPGEPERARIVGQRAKPHSPLIPLLLSLLPAAGLCIAAFVFARLLGRQAKSSPMAPSRRSSSASRERSDR